MPDDTDDEGDVPHVTADALQDRLDAGDPVRVLDIRDRDEVEQWRISGPSVAFTQEPYNQFVAARVRGDLDEFVDGVAGEGPITVVCARGESSADVAAALTDAGHDAHNLAGGMESWARLARTVELDAGLDGATVIQYRRPSTGCLGYLVVSGEEAAVVDPLRSFVDRYVEDARERGATVASAVDTHVHADHVSGLRDMADATDAEMVMSERAVRRGVTFDVTTVEDGDTLPVGGATLEAVAAPGHTTGMTAFAVRGGESGENEEDAPVLLTGDSLFLDSVARPDLERGADGARDLARDLYRTLTERFARFGDETVVAPGHHGEGARPADGGHVATLGDLRELPVFDMSAEAFADYVTDDMPAWPANFERLIAVNLGREAADADEAFELELGPNNCAATPATVE